MTVGKGDGVLTVHAMTTVGQHRLGEERQIGVG
jgi:hypothetical protein